MTPSASVAFGLAIAAFAQCGAAQGAQRTFVASTGSDGDPCTLSQPCRSFAAAMTHTDDHGEVVVLDSAGYGTFTIAQSVSIVAPPGVYAGITAFAGESAVTVNGSGITVSLRGLHLNGLAGSIHGVRYLDGSELYIDDCVITGFGGDGMRVQSGGRLLVRNTRVERNARGVGLVGVTAPDLAEVVLDRVGVTDSNGTGVSLGANATVLIHDTVIAGSASTAVVTGGLGAFDDSQAIVDRSRLVHNLVGLYPGGIVNALGETAVILSGSSISWNTWGWNVTDDPSVELYTLRNNTVRLNATNQTGKAEVVLTHD